MYNKCSIIMIFSFFWFEEGVNAQQMEFDPNDTSATEIITTGIHGDAHVNTVEYSGKLTGNKYKLTVSQTDNGAHIKLSYKTNLWDISSKSQQVPINIDLATLKIFSDRNDEAVVGIYLFFRYGDKKITCVVPINGECRSYGMLNISFDGKYKLELLPIMDQVRNNVVKQTSSGKMHKS